ncbi:heat shock factor 2-binding protein isoform X5 [Manacus candei]|uniref:heat shock factor 2-binding protein isoform X5 n=1 Tax=Manacus candei TaxID=415023 RepID=UPI0022264907|nr:heat shock factor 2-binding protein isoform X5 [Manacus candei]
MFPVSLVRYQGRLSPDAEIPSLLRRHGAVCSGGDDSPIRLLWVPLSLRGSLGLTLWTGFWLLSASTMSWLLRHSSGEKEKLDLRQQLNEAKQQLLQQAEYCTEMGAAVCTLLWGVSSNEEAVKTILGGSKAGKFFTITAQTMESFVKSLSEDMKQQDLDSDENQFVLALAGIVTNVAALACGREFLVSSSQELLDTMMHLLGDMKPGLCNKFKVLMLMSLYNVSINLKGLKYISESPGFIPLLWWLLNDPDTEVCLHALRLLQSVILEPEVLARTAPEMRDTLPFQRILALSKSRNADLQALAKELLEDLKIFEYEA